MTPPTKEENSSNTISKLIALIKTTDDEMCGSYGLWEMNSDECDSFNGNCTLCKVTKGLILIDDVKEWI